MSDFLSYNNKEKEIANAKKDVEQLKNLELNESEVSELKLFISEGVSITGLVSLFFLEKRKQELDETVAVELKYHGLINESNKMTVKGQEYLNSDEVKERFKQLL